MADILPRHSEAKPSADDMVRIAQDGVERVGRGFTAPDDDWQLVVILDGEDEDVIIAAGAMFENEMSKTLFSSVVLPGLIHQHNARALAMVTSAWAAPVDSTGPPSEHSDRREVVMVVGIDRYGGVKSSLAYIDRPPSKPPVLGPWGPLTAGLEGRMVDPLRAAFQRSWAATAARNN